MKKHTHKQTESDRIESGIGNAKRRADPKPKKPFKVFKNLNLKMFPGWYPSGAYETEAQALQALETLRRTAFHRGWTYKLEKK